MCTYIYIYICMYIILSVIVVFSSLSFYGEWTIPGTKRQPAILNLIDGGFLISSPCDPSVASLCHPWLTTTNLSYKCPIFETSATTLCGTTGIYIYLHIYFFYRRKFRSQTSDNMDRWKAEMGRVREKRRVEERRSEKRKSQKKEDADARKGRKVAKHYVFQMICGSGRSKIRLAKVAGAEPSGQMRDEKLHAVVARSIYRSQNVQNTPASDHFWKLRCQKSARCCGAKQISKSKCTKHTRSGPLLEVEMSKKCTQLWHEAHLQVKKLKADTPRSEHFWKLSCRKSDAVVARSTFRSQNVKNTRGPDHFWTLRCRSAWQAQGIKSEQNVRVL